MVLQIQCDKWKTKYITYTLVKNNNANDTIQLHDSQQYSTSTIVDYNQIESAH